MLKASILLILEGPLCVCVCMCVCEFVCLSVPILLLDHPADLLNFWCEDPSYNGGEPDWCFIRFRLELTSLLMLFHHFPPSNSR